MLRTKRSDYSELIQDDSSDFPLRTQKARQDPTLEAEVLPNDTLASLSLRFNCSVQEIRRLNKIVKDNEIHALRVVKVPLTAQNILLDTLPKVHTSGQNSPKNKEKVPSASEVSIPSKETLEEKLLLASVSNAVIQKSIDVADHSSTIPEDDVTTNPLIDRTKFRGYPRPIRGNDYLSFSGSDCELNWIVLLIGVLAVCVIVPLIYVYFVYEHPEEFSHQHIRYDDPDPKYLHHLHEKNATTPT